MNPFKNVKVLRENCSFEVYDRQTSERGKGDFVMSRGDLMEFARCPRRWVDGYEPPETKPKQWGSLIDCLLLLPQTFGDKYAVQPATYPAPKGHAKVKKGEISEGDPLPWNNNATVCAEWTEAQIGKTVISYDVSGEAHQAVERLLADPRIAELVKVSGKQFFVQGEYHDADTGLAVPVKGLIDLVPTAIHPLYGKCLADLKTANTGSRGAYQRHVFDLGYYIQAAFYLDLWTAATGEDRCEFRHIVQEAFAPWTTCRRLISAEFVEAGRIAYQQALRDYAQALKRNEWPDYETGDRVLDGWSIVEMEPWMLRPTSSMFPTEPESGDAASEMPS